MNSVLKRLFEALSLHQINIILITQASSELSICIVVTEDETQLARKAINETFAYEIQLKRKTCRNREKSGITVLVGDNMKSHQA